MSASPGPKTSKVTERGQTTIPKLLREKYAIGPEDTVVRENTEEGIVIRKVIRDAGRGMWIDSDLSTEEREEVARELEEELRTSRETEWAID